MKKIYIMAGLPLAGKTTWIEENKDLFPHNYNYISADLIKAKNPDYDPNNAHLLHEWSVQEAKLAIKRGITTGDFMVFDSGSINNNYTINIFKELKEAGYHIVLVHINTPYRVCLDRNKVRTRKVPEVDITDKALKEISQIYKLRALADEFISVDHHTNKYLFVDMDGVIAAQSVLPIIDGKIDFVNGEIHKWQKPVGPVIAKLRALEEKGHELYILSATPNSVSSDEKIEWLEKYFPIAKDRIYFVNQGKHKAEMLDNIRRKLKVDKRHITLIDDLHTTLEKVESLRMKAMHPSVFLTHEF